MKVPLILTLLGLIGILPGCLARLSSLPSEGSPLQQLTHEPSQDFYADWSPDGQKIAIISDRSGAWNVWVIHSDGSNPVAFTSDHQATSPSWSPDGSMITYATDRASGMRFWTDLWIMRSDGSLHEPLIQTPTMKDLLPSGSPDGRHIAFLSLDMNAPPAWWVVVMDLEARTPNVVARQKIIFSRLAWSPDGEEIAFVSDRSGRPEVWIMDRDGGHPKSITRDGAEKEHLAWSPDGNRIAFSSKRAGNWDIWLVRPDGTGLKRLTASPATDTLPDWSPDGHSIAFTSDRAGNQDIWIIRMSGEL